MRNFRAKLGDIFLVSANITLSKGFDFILSRIGLRQFVAGTFLVTLERRILVGQRTSSNRSSRCTKRLNSIPLILEFTNQPDPSFKVS